MPEDVNWNVRFERALAMPEEGEGNKLVKYKELTAINKDFVETSTVYGKTIISEFFIPDEQKSVQLKEVGGVAGGKKFVCRGILFKLADGSHGPYGGSDEAAAKAASHDLKGAIHCFKCGVPGLHFALQALIDYKGFRLHAQAVLPVSASTLRVGTSDGGRTVKAEDPLLLRKMQLAAQQLNLRGHSVRGKRLYFCADLEGHRGHDGLHYLLDFARAFPPESPLMTAHLDPSPAQRQPTPHAWAARAALPAQAPRAAETAGNGGDNHLSESSALACRGDIKSPAPSVTPRPQRLSIFWRMLRPEFLKNRGAPVREKRLARRSTQEASGVEGYPTHASSFPAGCWEDMVSSRKAPDHPSAAPSGYAPASVLLQAQDVLAGEPYDGYAPGDALCSKYSGERSGYSYCDSYDLSADAWRPTETPPAQSRQHALAAALIAKGAISSKDLWTLTPPLSSDALSGFSEADPEREARNAEVHLATYVLVYRAVPALAAELMDVYAEGGSDTEVPLTELLHRHGINARHQGWLRHHVRPNEAHGPLDIGWPRIVVLRGRLLVDLLARALKNLLRDRQRAWMKLQRSASEHGMLLEVVAFLNLVTAATHGSGQHFWQGEVLPALYARFGECSLDAAEASDLQAAVCSLPLDMDPGGELSSEACGLTRLLLKLCTMTGVQLARDALDGLLAAGDQARGFEFVASDIRELLPLVKHMHQVDYAEGMVLQLLAQEREGHQSDRQRPIVGRLGAMACQRFHRALQAVPDDLRTRHALADMYQARGFALKDADPGESEKLFKVFRQLREDDKNTRCSATSVPYQKDILGIVIRVKRRSDHSLDTCWRDSDVISLQHYLQVYHPKNSTPQEVYRSPSEASLASKASHAGSQDWRATPPLSESRSVSDPAARARGHSGPGRRGTKPPYRFLPLVIDEEHGARARSLMEEEMARIMSPHLPDAQYQCCLVPDDTPAVGVGQGDLLRIQRSKRVPEFKPCHALAVLSNLMNSTVVSFVEKWDSPSGAGGGQSGPAWAESEAGRTGVLLGYLRFHHLLLFFCRLYPEMQREASERVERFASCEAHRTKQHTPNLGEFLVWLLLSDRGWDASLKGAFVSEVWDRNVRWLVTRDARSIGFPELLFMEKDRVSHYRLVKAFEGALTSQRVCMFQIHFMEAIGRREGCSHQAMLELYNASYGRATAGMQSGLKRAYKLILRASFWPDFFDFVGLWLSPEVMTVRLRNAVRNSARKGYYLVDLRAMQMSPDPEPEPEPPSPAPRLAGSPQTQHSGAAVSQEDMKQQWDEVLRHWGHSGQECTARWLRYRRFVQAHIRPNKRRTAATPRPRPHAAPTPHQGPGPVRRHRSGGTEGPGPPAVRQVATSTPAPASQTPSSRPASLPHPTTPGGVVPRPAKTISVNPAPPTHTQWHPAPHRANLHGGTIPDPPPPLTRPSGLNPLAASYHPVGASATLTGPPLPAQGWGTTQGRSVARRSGGADRVCAPNGSWPAEGLAATAPFYRTAGTVLGVGDQQSRAGRGRQSEGRRSPSHILGSKAIEAGHRDVGRERLHVPNMYSVLDDEDFGVSSSSEGGDVFV